MPSLVICFSISNQSTLFPEPVTCSGRAYCSSTSFPRYFFFSSEMFCETLERPKVAFTFSLRFYLRDADTLSRHHSAYDRGAWKSSIRATAKCFKRTLSLLMQAHTYMIVAALGGSPSTFAIPSQRQIVASIFDEALRITTTDGLEQSRASFSASG